ncbi:unnamed protein product [Clonostachys rosea f. rosea IK726]|uniref:Lysyl-tRNA synthetase n=2 Tax=Bionectria ochroleuca TaxID=29856 RepID=A0A0B7JXR2_BIOOC|nr:unnamed protein product [Clonostachys rosea f. rosea IK726]
MNSPIRLRLACQSVLYRSLRPAPKSSPVSSRLRAPVLLGEYSRHFTSSVQCSGANRFSSELEPSEDDELSPFKKQRQAEFEEDKNSEEPLFPDPYPRLEKSKHERKSVSDFLASFHGEAKEAPKEVTLCGRIRSKRSAGKALIFVDIVHEFRKVQVMINRQNLFIRSEDGINKFSLFKKMIQVGDHISVVGIPSRTKAGEMTLSATAMPKLLAPTMEQIPKTLIDPKAKMQGRHVDMLVNREVVDVLRLRSEIMRFMRDHLHSKRFLEFQTPILAENAGGAVARPFVTHATGFGKKDLSLRIAPELWLKRLVIGGVDKVFEIGPSFRNEGIDATHNPEFTMCEFYSAYTNLGDLIKETEEIIHGLARRSQELISSELTSLQPIDLSRFVRPFKQVEFVPGLEAAMGIRLPKLSSKDALPELIAVLKLAGIKIAGETPTTLDKLLDRLAAMYLEPQSFDKPLFITHHPACMSPLAKSFLCPRTYQLVSARAELFFGGRELANMYEEENNPEEQKQKLAMHRRLANAGNGKVVIEEPAIGEVVETDSEAELSGPQEVLEEEEEEEDLEAAPLDESFARALDFGLPPTGGWGCGVERLVMVFSGASRISDCLSFGTLKNVVGLTAGDDFQKPTLPSSANSDAKDATNKNTPKASEE